MVLTEQTLADGRKYITVPQECHIKDCHNPVTHRVDGTLYPILVCDDHAENNRHHTTAWNPATTGCDTSNCNGRCNGRVSHIVHTKPGVAKWNDVQITHVIMKCSSCFDKMVLALTKPAEIVVDGVTYARKRET